MDLNYAPEDIAFRKQVWPWLDQNLPKKEIANLEERRARHRKLFEAGYLGMGWPEEYGGAEPRVEAVGLFLVRGRLRAAAQGRRQGEVALRQRRPGLRTRVGIGGTRC
jgi:alkylation response protein AidB-like acyl-CoA dehydrogenase